MDEPPSEADGQQSSLKKIRISSTENEDSVMKLDAEEPKTGDVGSTKSNKAKTTDGNGKSLQADDNLETGKQHRPVEKSRNNSGSSFGLACFAAKEGFTDKMKQEVKDMETEPSRVDGDGSKMILVEGTLKDDTGCNDKNSAKNLIDSTELTHQLKDAQTENKRLRFELNDANNARRSLEHKLEALGHSSSISEALESTGSGGVLGNLGTLEAKNRELSKRNLELFNTLELTEAQVKSRDKTIEKLTARVKGLERQINVSRDKKHPSETPRHTSEHKKKTPETTPKTDEELVVYSSGVDYSSYVDPTGKKNLISAREHQGQIGERSFLTGVNFWLFSTPDRDERIAVCRHCNFSDTFDSPEYLAQYLSRLSLHLIRDCEHCPKEEKQKLSSCVQFQRGKLKMSAFAKQVWNRKLPVLDHLPVKLESTPGKGKSKPNKSPLLSNEQSDEEDQSPVPDVVSSSGQKRLTRGTITDVRASTGAKKQELFSLAEYENDLNERNYTSGRHFWFFQHAEREKRVCVCRYCDFSFTFASPDTFPNTIGQMPLHLTRECERVPTAVKTRIEACVPRQKGQVKLPSFAKILWQRKLPLYLEGPTDKVLLTMAQDEGEINQRIYVTGQHFWWFQNGAEGRRRVAVCRHCEATKPFATPENFSATVSDLTLHLGRSCPLCSKADREHIKSCRTGRQGNISVPMFAEELWKRKVPILNLDLEAYRRDDFVGAGSEKDSKPAAKKSNEIEEKVSISNRSRSPKEPFQVVEKRGPGRPRRSSAPNNATVERKASPVLKRPLPKTNKRVLLSLPKNEGQIIERNYQTGLQFYVFGSPSEPHKRVLLCRHCHFTHVYDSPNHMARFMSYLNLHAARDCEAIPKAERNLINACSSRTHGKVSLQAFTEEVWARKVPLDDLPTERKSKRKRPVAEHEVDDELSDAEADESQESDEDEPPETTKDKPSTLLSLPHHKGQISERNFEAGRHMELTASAASGRRYLECRHCGSTRSYPSPESFQMSKLALHLLRDCPSFPVSEREKLAACPTIASSSASMISFAEEMFKRDVPPYVPGRFKGEEKEEVDVVAKSSLNSTPPKKTSPPAKEPKPETEEEKSLSNQLLTLPVNQDDISQRNYHAGRQMWLLSHPSDSKRRIIMCRHCNATRSYASPEILSMAVLALHLIRDCPSYPQSEKDKLASLPTATRGKITMRSFLDSVWKRRVPACRAFKTGPGPRPASGSMGNLPGLLRQKRTIVLAETPTSKRRRTSGVEAKRGDGKVSGENNSSIIAELASRGEQNASRLKYPIDTRFMKTFGEFGEFEGRVVGHDGRFYLVEYPFDGDEEDMTEQDLDVLISQPLHGLSEQSPSNKSVIETAAIAPAAEAKAPAGEAAGEHSGDEVGEEDDDEEDESPLGAISDYTLF